MAAVALQRVSKTYPNGVRAVHDLCLSVADGELLVLVGPSDCGKTTTLRLIAGLEVPSAGVIRIGGQVVNGVPPHRWDVAMAFQRPALYPHLTVRQNLAFSLSLRRSWFARRSAAEAERVRQVTVSDTLPDMPLFALPGTGRTRPGPAGGDVPDGLRRRAAPVATGLGRCDSLIFF